MNDASVGAAQVVLSMERKVPFGQRQTAVGPFTAGAPDLDLTAGARRQRWEQRSWSQGLDMAGWERACISCRKKRRAHPYD